MFTYTEYFMPSKLNTEEMDIDEIVREDLMLQYKEELKNGINNTDFLDSLLQVIEFYCTGKQYRDFYFSVHKEEDSDG